MHDLPNVDWSTADVIFNRVVEHEGVQLRERLLRVTTGKRFVEKLETTDLSLEAHGVQA
jgi:hypothetical protein